MDLGKRFKRFRVKAGYNQKEAAELIGVNNYQLGNYETNRSEPNITALKKMSEIYGVSIDALVGNFPAMKVQENAQELDDELYDFDYLVKKVEEISNKLNELEKK